jgi:hypothetical protein
MIALQKKMITLFVNGPSGWSDDSMDRFLKVPTHEATAEDLKRLSKAELMQLFHAAESPDFQSMKGEYKAEVISAGVMSPLAELFIHHLFGPGRWIGKAFFPFESRSGWGYNLFSEKKNEGAPPVIRCCKMATRVGPSYIDDKESFHLDYSPYNRSINYTLHDELRKIHDTLFLGMGYMGFSVGAIMPAPFLLYGEPTEWVGPDKE